MQIFLPSAVLILTVSVGMILRFADLLDNWRALTWGGSTRLLLATFVVAALALAMGSLRVSLALLSRETSDVQTLAISKVNRQVGIALLLSGTHFQNAKGALPVIASYALAMPLRMVLYTRLIHRPPSNPQAHE